MDAGTWIALGTFGLSAEGAIIYGSSKLARMATSLDDLKVSVGRVAEKVQDHENRLNKAKL